MTRNRRNRRGASRDGNYPQDNRRPFRRSRHPGPDRNSSRPSNAGSHGSRQHLRSHSPRPRHRGSYGHRPSPPSNHPRNSGFIRNRLREQTNRVVEQQARLREKVEWLKRNTEVFIRDGGKVERVTDHTEFVIGSQRLREIAQNCPEGQKFHVTPISKDTLLSMTQEKNHQRLDGNSDELSEGEPGVKQEAQEEAERKAQDTARQSRHMAPPPKFQQKDPKVCFICKKGSHVAVRCFAVVPGTGMTKYCPIHPRSATHGLDECRKLLEWLTCGNNLRLLHSSMGPLRRGFPPVYTELIDINELTQHLGKPLDQQPWSVRHSTNLWHNHEDQMDSLLYHSDIDLELPVGFEEHDRAADTSPQTLLQRPPKYGNLHSLVAYLTSQRNTQKSQPPSLKTEDHEEKIKTEPSDDDGVPWGPPL
ncbi:hypothetical protein PG987_001502 [Apiospora arundinis]